MQHTIILLLLLFSFELSGQVSGTVTDKTTGLPIQFANVFLKDIPVGTTTDINGHFEIKTIKTNNIVIISAIGYESQQVNDCKENIIINLIPRTYELAGVKVKPEKHRSKLVINPYNKRRINSYIACAGYPYIVSKYFRYLPEYSSTPCLKQVKLFTSATNDSVLFNLRIISVNEDGTPGFDIPGKNLIILAQQGARENTIVDLSSYHFTFPESGLIIAVEWLIIEQNKTNWKYQSEYLPQFGAVTKEGEDINWTYLGGRWQKNNLLSRGKTNVYRELAVELTLTD